MLRIRKFINKRTGLMTVGIVLTLALAMFLGTASGVLAAGEVPLDTAGASVNVTGTVGGTAIYQVYLPTDPTGSGTFDSFVRISSTNPNTFERGYNTDQKPPPLDDKSGAFTHNELLSAVPVVQVGGVLYREFQCDINQNDKSPDWYLSLDKLQIWLTDAAHVNSLVYTEGANFPSATGGHFQASYASLVWEQPLDTWYRLNYDLNAGSGKRDLKVLIPEAAFQSVISAQGYTNPYVVLFTDMGRHEGDNDGYEEWGVAIYNYKSGYKFNDQNGNGVWDASEPGLNGWTIKLDGTASGPHGGTPVHLTFVTTNDANGNPGWYLFGVVDGTYTVSEVQQAGWTQTYPPSPGTYTITVSGGVVDSDNNFGNSACG